MDNSEYCHHAGVGTVERDGPFPISPSNRCLPNVRVLDFLMGKPQPVQEQGQPEHADCAETKVGAHPMQGLSG